MSDLWVVCWDASSIDYFDYCHLHPTSVFFSFRFKTLTVTTSTSTGLRSHHFLPEILHQPSNRLSCFRTCLPWAAREVRMKSKCSHCFSCSRPVFASILFRLTSVVSWWPVTAAGPVSFSPPSLRQWASPPFFSGSPNATAYKRPSLGGHFQTRDHRLSFLPISFCFYQFSSSCLTSREVSVSIWIYRLPVANCRSTGISGPAAHLHPEHVGYVKELCLAQEVLDKGGESGEVGGGGHSEDYSCQITVSIPQNLHERRAS